MSFRAAAAAPVDFAGRLRKEVDKKVGWGMAGLGRMLPSGNISHDTLTFMNFYMEDAVFALGCCTGEKTALAPEVWAAWMCNTTVTIIGPMVNIVAPSDFYCENINKKIVPFIKAALGNVRITVAPSDTLRRAMYAA